MPSPLTDLYQRYKIGTKRVEQWLTDLANRDSTVQDVVSSRKASSSKNGAGRKSETAIKLSTKELIAVTDRIAEAAAAKGRIPADLGSTVIILEDVISGRREYKLWHQQRTQEKDATYEREIASHDHFIDVLVEILRRLKGIQTICQKSTTKQNGKKRSGKARKGPKADFVEYRHDDSEATVMSKIYGGLPSNEAELTQDLTGISISKSATEPRTFVTVELERPYGESDFALWCFLKDCHKVRLFLRNMWEEYYDDKLSIQVAGEVTNKAFLLLSKAAEEFKADFPHLASFEQVADHLQIRGQSQGGEIKDFSYGNGDSCKGSPETKEAMELLCIPAFLTLLGLRETFSALNTLRDDVFDMLDLSLHNEAFSCRLMRAIMSMLDIPPEILSLLRQSALWVDTFTSKMVTNPSFGERELCIDHVMHYQICMDVSNIRGHRRGESYPWKYMKDYLEDTARFYKSQAPGAMKACNTPYQDRHPYRDDAIHVANLFLASPSNEAAEPRQMYGGRVLPHLWAFQAAFPVFCGRFVNYTLQMHHLDGLITCQQGGLVAAMAHLYRTSLETGLSKRKWPDMEHVIRQLGAANLGLPDQPAASSLPIQCAERFGRAFGVKAADYTKERRRHRTPHPSRVPLPQTDRVLVEEEDIFKVIKSPSLAAELQRLTMNGSLGLSASEATDLSMQQMAQAILTSSSDVDDDTKAQWQASRRLDITKLLALAKEQVAAEEFQGCFNYQAFFVSVMNHLMHLKTVYNKELSTIRQAVGAPVDFNMVEMVHEILFDAASQGRSGLRYSLLACVAGGMDSMIEKCGSAFSALAKERLAPMLRLNHKDGDPNRPLPTNPSVANDDSTSVAIAGSRLDYQFTRTPEKTKARDEMMVRWRQMRDKRLRAMADMVKGGQQPVTGASKM